MRSHSKSSTLCSLLLAGLLAPLGWPLPADAADRYVNPWIFVGSDGVNVCLDRTNPCLTIRQAVTMALPGDRIFLVSWPFLAFGDIDVVVDKNLTFVGVCASGAICPAGRVKINARDLGRHFDIQPNVEVTMSNLELYRGRGTAVNGNGTNGGSILNLGRLTLFNCYLYDNRATNGGGIYVADGASLSTGSLSVLQNNHADIDGGAVYNDGGDVSTTLASFMDNHAGDGSGGAIMNTGDGTLSITQSEFTRNHAAIRNGGAIADIGTGPFSVTKSQFLDNSATNGGAIHVASIPWSSTVVRAIDSVTFAGNSTVGHGGAIYYEPEDGQLTIVNSTLSRNSGDRGGAIYNSGLAPGSIGSVELVSTTFYGNAAREGAAIYNARSLEMNYSIITGSTDLNGVRADSCSNVDSITGTGNLIGTAPIDDPSCNSTGTVSAGQVTFFNTTLWTNGGPIVGAFNATIKTHALNPGSNAIDSIPSATCLVSVDQRGVERPRKTGQPKCDAGAVEQR